MLERYLGANLEHVDPWRKREMPIAMNGEEYRC